MVRTPRTSWLVVAAFLVAASHAFADAADTPVNFAITTNTTPGQSLFVLGNIPQLGGGQVNQSIKLAITNSCTGSTCPWSLTIGIPPGTPYTYQYLVRDDCALCYSNPANVVASFPMQGGATPAGPPAPFTGKTIFYYSTWSSVSLLYSNTATASWQFQPMAAVGPGRTAGEKLWRVDNINRTGESNLIFIVRNVTGTQTNWDNLDGQANTNYETSLDALVLQDGEVYNYWPPSFVSTNIVVDTFQITPNTGLSNRTIRVLLPRGYYQNPSKRYPVLYMHDGQNLFQGMVGLSGYSWNADITAATLMQLGKMRETIIVGVDCSAYFGVRLQEYTPPQCTPPTNAPSLGGQYTDFLINQLKPYIDNTYSITAGRTLTDPDDTGVLGSSMGGLISAYLGWTYPDTYHKVGCMSSSFWVCDPITTGTSQPIRIYLDSGDQDLHQGGTNYTGTSDSLLNTVQERDNLINDGFDLDMNLYHTIGYGQWHSEQWWAARLPGCYTFLFPTSDEPDTVLDRAWPPRIVGLQPVGGSNVVTWTAYQQRTYSLQGSTNQTYSGTMNWTNLYTTPVPEPLPWDYPSAGASNNFQFLRVLEYGVPNWPN